MFNFNRNKDPGSETAMEGLENIKHAVDQRLIDFERGRIHNDLYIHVDKPDGTVRITYMMFNPAIQNEVIARCAIIFVGEMEGFGVWSIDWAVSKGHRRKGFGSSLVTKSINEFKSGMAGKTNGSFWLEAVVSKNNKYSNSIASKIIGNCETLINEDTGEKVNNYLQKIND